MGSKKLIYASGCFLGCGSDWELLALNQEILEASDGQLSLFFRSEPLSDEDFCLFDADLGLIFAGSNGVSASSMVDFMLMKLLDIPVVVLEAFPRVSTGGAADLAREVGGGWASWPRTEIQRECTVDLFTEAKKKAEKELDIRFEIVRNVAGRLIENFNRASSAPTVFPSERSSMDAICRHISTAFQGCGFTEERMARFVAKKFGGHRLVSDRG
jgi:hypothetical protein